MMAITERMGSDYFCNIHISLSLSLSLSLWNADQNITKFAH